MFGNKKNNKQDDDLELTVRSMKTDSEGTSPDINEQNFEEESPKRVDYSDNQAKQSKQFNPKEKEEKSGFDKLNEQIQKEDSQKKTMPNINRKMPENKEKQAGEAKKSSSPFPPKSKLEEEVPEEENKKSLSSMFAIILIIVLLIAAGSGGYYYFFVIKKQSAQPQSATPPFDSGGKTTEPTTEPVVAEEDLPIVLESADVLELQEGAGIESILAGSTDAENGLQEGFYVIRKENQQTSMNIEQAKEVLDVEVIPELENATEKIWLYYDPSAKEETTKASVGLLFEVDSRKTTDIRKAYLSNESSLPFMFSGLYPEISKEDPRLKNTNFMPSQINEGFRYYNINPQDDSKSFDWSIVETKSASFLVIATSRKMAGEMLSKISR